jgi:NDP-sugar pyrophosphorylase family protein
MKAIILAGGKTNLPGKLKNTPKSLIEIKGKPVLEYQLELLKKYGFDDICLTLFYKSEEILKYLKKKDPKGSISGKNGKIAGIEYVLGSNALGTGGAIRNAAQGIKKDFLVMNGDTLSNFNISDFVKFYKKNISEPRFFSSSQFFKTLTPHILPLEISPLRKRVSHEDIIGAMAVFYTQEQSEYGLVKIKNDRVVEFVEKPDYQYSGYLNAGFYILSPQIFETKSFKSQKKGTAFSVEKIVFPELAKNSQLLGYVHRGLWTDIGSEEGLKIAESIVDRLNEKEG